MKLFRPHIAVLSVLLITACVAYGTLALIAPDTATAFAVGFIALVLCASCVLRLLRKV